MGGSSPAWPLKFNGGGNAASCPSLQPCDVQRWGPAGDEAGLGVHVLPQPCPPLRHRPGAGRELLFVQRIFIQWKPAALVGKHT